jgi:hypothetical protein
MKMAEIRAEIHRFAGTLPNPDDEAWLHFLAEQTRRRRPVRRAPRQRYNKITQPQVIDFFRSNPRADYMTCAATLGSNIGRVSEKLTGYRT